MVTSMATRGRRALKGNLKDKKARRPKGRAVGALLAYVALSAIILLLDAVTAVDTGSRANERYSDQTKCWDCHPDHTSGWNGTRHAVDFSHYYVDEEGQYENLYIFSDGECTRCHVVGYANAAAGGYDPALPWNGTNNSMRLRIQCEDCHGPSSPHDGLGSSVDEQASGTLRWPTARTCADTGAYGGLGGCHGPGGYDRYTPWRSSEMSGSNDETGVNDTACYVCHYSEPFVLSMNGSHPGPRDPLAEPVSCIACHDPHAEPGSAVQDHSLRDDPEDLCADCHLSVTPIQLDDGTIVAAQGSMRKGMGGQGVSGTYVPSDNSSCYKCHMYETPDGYPTPHSSHEFDAVPMGCADCHDGINKDAPTKDWPATRDEDPSLWDEWTAWEANATALAGEWQGIIDEIQTTVLARLADVTAQIEQVNMTLIGYRAWRLADANLSDSAGTLLAQAEWNIEFVEGDRSEGVHNTNYTHALLNASEDMADVAMTWLDTPLLLEPGFVTGDPEKGIPTNLTITFADRAGREPASVQAIVNGVTHNMTTVDRTTSTYDGRVYTLSVSLAEGQHDYSFIADNGIMTAESDMFSGNVTVPPNLPPVAVLDSLSYKGVTGLPLMFSANGSYDPEGNLTALEWRFGDGSMAFGASVEHAYSTTGIYQLRLTAVDGRGKSSNTTALVEIMAPEVPDGGGGTDKSENKVIPESMADWIGENRVAFLLLIGLIFVSALVLVENMKATTEHTKGKGKRRKKRQGTNRGMKKKKKDRMRSGGRG